MVKEKKARGLAEIETSLNQAIDELAKQCDCKDCFPLLLGDDHISGRLVDKVYDRLLDRYPSCASKRFILILDSGGGDIDAAYNLAQLFRKYGPERFEVYVPRWAKSAATLVACAGDVIWMTPVAELGPLDPQITQMNPLEQRLEQFSPLHIESTLELIRNEYKNGHKELADGLMSRLQFPLTLGSFKKSLELARQYLEKLLTSRMLQKTPERGKEAARRLTEDYADHGFCINLAEAQAIGLTAKELPSGQLPVVWKIHKLTREKRDLERKHKQKEMAKRLKDIPPELLDRLPPDLTDTQKAKPRNTIGGQDV